MDLSIKSNENVQFMIDEIKTKLKMASGSVIRPNHFNVSHYDNIKDIYDMIMSRDNISISEMEAIVTELGRIRA